MANKVPFYRMYLNEKLRKFLGINLKTHHLYIFKIKGKTYISADMIPKTVKFDKIEVRLGDYRWFINIPITYLEYTPSTYRLLNTPGRVIELRQ